jgi:hypothetical protein
VEEYWGPPAWRVQVEIEPEMTAAATAISLSRLFDHMVCHEGYPGHHTDYVLKEQYLARRGYTEQTMYLTLVPQCVISEGIAMVAHELIFSEGEAERWIGWSSGRSMQTRFCCYVGLQRTVRRDRVRTG